MGVNHLQDLIGNTSLVSLDRLSSGSTSQIYAKLEMQNPSGSSMDRVVRNMLICSERRGEITPGDTLIEATSGSTGIALAMAATRRGYRVLLVITEDLPKEMRTTMTALGAELIPTTDNSDIERARKLASELENQGVGILLDQFSNPDNPDAHYKSTGPEIWNDSKGEITHFVSCMGTTGTIVGIGRYLKEKNPSIQVIGVRPIPGSRILGLNNWSSECLPNFYDPSFVDDIMEITPELACETVRRLIQQEGLFAGISSGASVAAALRLCRRLDGAVVATIIADRGDRYLSTGIFD